MATLFTVDGIAYDVRIPAGGLTREVSILDGENAGRKKSGGMDLDTIGTYYNYSLEISRNGSNVADYNALHKTLRDPRNRRHLITMPFDDGTVTYEAYVANLSDSLQRVHNGTNYWNGLTIKFTALDPNETP